MVPVEEDDMHVNIELTNIVHDEQPVSYSGVLYHVLYCPLVFFFWSQTNKGV